VRQVLVAVEFQHSGFFQVVKPTVCHLSPEFRILLQLMQPFPDGRIREDRVHAWQLLPDTKPWADGRSSALTQQGKKSGRPPKSQSMQNGIRFRAVEYLCHRMLSQITQVERLLFL